MSDTPEGQDDTATEEHGMATIIANNKPLTSPEYAEFDVTVGDRITFAEEKQAYTVRAVSEDGRYLICTKPFNLRRDILYCIVDTVEQRRGPDDRIFGPSYSTDEQIAENMARLVAGEMAVSRRRDLPLSIARVRPSTT